jgi:C1A family cysteine protease
MSKRKYGWVPDIPDHRDLTYSAPHALPLPEKVDLRPFMPGVYDQGELGSCTANAISAILEYCEIRQKKAAVEPPSRLFIYYNERELESSIPYDAGAQIRDGIKTLSLFGFCPERIWPYAISRFAERPPEAAYASARKEIVDSYARVPQNSRGLRSCLAEAHPVVFGFSVFSSFETPEVARTGIMPVPKRGEELLGGHAVLIVGYDDREGMYIVRNSWGAGFGQGGYFKMPYEVAHDPKLSDDFWTVRLVP